MTRGRKRSTKGIPSHIDPTKLPKGCYWDNSGRGHWFTKYVNEAGQWRRKRIAGPQAKLSELHKIIELADGIDRNTFAWIAKEFQNSDQYIELAKSTKHTYDYALNVVKDHPTKIGIKLGKAPLSKWNKPMVQRLIDKISKDRGPTSANHVLRYVRRVFRWAVNRGHASENPAQGIEAAKERKRQRLPSDATYSAVLSYAKNCAKIAYRTKGSCSPYLWAFMELAFLLRMRGEEVLRLSDANCTDEGIIVDRLKGSRGNITLWTSRLRSAWDAADSYRKFIQAKQNIPVQMNPKDRWLFLSQDGTHLRKSGLDSVWQRMIKTAISDGVISADDRFSPHDLKRLGITKTEGTWADKKEAGGHKSDSMRDVYDKSRPRVMPSE